MDVYSRVLNIQIISEGQNAINLSEHPSEILIFVVGVQRYLVCKFYEFIERNTTWHPTCERFLMSKNMSKQKTIDIWIDGLTNSIVNTISGDSLPTHVIEVTAQDLKLITKS